MTTDYEKIMRETSFNIIREEEDMMAISLVGGELNDVIIEFNDINLLYDGETEVTLEYDYKVISENENSITKDKDFQKLLTNILYSAIGEQMQNAENELSSQDFCLVGLAGERMIRIQKKSPLQWIEECYQKTIESAPYAS